MQTQRIAAVLIGALAFMGCEGSKQAPPPGEVYEHPEIDGICGVNHAKCQDLKQTMTKFRNLPRFTYQQQCVKGSDQQTVALSFQVPRLLNTHTGPRDTVMMQMQASNLSSEGADYAFTLYRNNDLTMAATVDRYGDVLSDWHAALGSDDIGVIETFLALFAQPSVYKRINAANNACENTSPILWPYKINGMCLACNLYKLGFAALAGVTAKAAAESKIIGSLIAVGVGDSTKEALDALFTCDKECAVGKCGVKYDTCLENLTDAKVCNAALSMCCMEAEGRCVTCSALRGEHARAGSHCCCFL